jgi:DNA-binding protein HU-beta
MAKAGKPMTKSQILDHIAQENEITKKQAGTIMDSIVNLAYSQAKTGFTLPGLGKLVLSNRKARMGRNPQTGEAIKIAARTVVRFRLGKAAKDAILGGGSSNGKAKKTTKAKAKPAAKKPAAKKTAAKRR